MAIKRTKILHTIRQGDVGGGETYLYNLVTRLDRQQFEPVVLSFTEGEMVEQLKERGIKTFVIPTLKPFNVFIYPQIRRILQQEEIDILHTHGTRAATNTLIPGLLNKVPCIYTVHGWSFHTGNSILITQLRIFAERFLTRFSSITICGSKADMELGSDYCPGGNYQLINNSIDTQIFNPYLPIQNLRSKLGFSEKNLVISFIARLTFQKDPLTFIRSAYQAYQQIPQAKFLMVGEGELNKECLKLADQLGIQDKITFLPFRKDIKELLYLSDIFVLPSLWEVIPLGLLEAMAMEKSCIATNILGTTEAIINEKNGLLIEVNAPEQLTQKIIYLANNPELRIKLGKAARQTVVAQFDINTLVKQNEKIYQAFVGSSKEASLLAPGLSIPSNYPFIAS